MIDSTTTGVLCKPHALIQLHTVHYATPTVAWFIGFGAPIAEIIFLLLPEHANRTCNMRVKVGDKLSCPYVDAAIGMTKEFTFCRDVFPHISIFSLNYSPNILYSFTFLLFPDHSGNNICRPGHVMLTSCSS